MTQKSPKRSAKPKALSLVFEIEIAATEYSLRIADEHHHRLFKNNDAYFENFTLTMRGRCIHPAILADREPVIRITASENMSGRAAPVGGTGDMMIGNIETRKGKFELWAMLPTEPCWKIGLGVGAGVVRYLVVQAHPLFRGTTDIVGLSFFGPEHDLQRFLSDVTG